MPRFSANLNFLFPEVPSLERFGAAARAGFRAVESPSPYDEPPGEIRRRLEDAGLVCVLFNLPMGDRVRGDMGMACLPDRVAEFREGVPRAIDAAHTLSCPRVNCIAGRPPEGTDP